MADKLTQLVLEALTLAAAEPGGLPLYRSKAEPGLFAASAAGKPAARKAIDEGFLAPVPAAEQLVSATEKGLRYLVDNSSPRQVLEDFVRGLERREGEVQDLLAATRRLGGSLESLKAAVAVVLPQVSAARVPCHAVSRPPHPEPGRCAMPAAVAPKVAAAEELAPALLTHLADWAASAAAGQDCPLPELFRALGVRAEPPTIGQFHDCLRGLADAGRVYLHPWTGPLYALPEPAYALLVGHNIAYYASPRK